jgi:hypothetical protein
LNYTLDNASNKWWSQIRQVLISSSNKIPDGKIHSHGAKLKFQENRRERRSRFLLDSVLHGIKQVRQKLVSRDLNTVIELFRRKLEISILYLKLRLSLSKPIDYIFWLFT